MMIKVWRKQVFACNWDEKREQENLYVISIVEKGTSS